MEVTQQQTTKSLTGKPFPCLLFLQPNPNTTLPPKMSLPISTNLKLTVPLPIPDSTTTHVTSILSFLTDTPRPSPIVPVFRDGDSDPRNSCAKIYSDRKERAVADLLTRFKNLVSLAASPVEDGATKEVAAAQGFVMEVESTALVMSL